MTAFSLENLGSSPLEDPQARLLTNALKHFCDKIEQDNQSKDVDNTLTVRDVTWRYGSMRFRAKLATLEGQFSSGEYFYSDGLGREWSRLPTPRALAEKLTEAKPK